MLHSRKAQSTLEYAIITAVVVASLLAMQIYVKRGLQGRMRSSTDSIGEQYSAGITTSKKITKYADGTKQETVERFGLGDHNVAAGSADWNQQAYLDKGLSVSRIENAATTKVLMDGSENSAAEQVTKNLSDEELFNKQGTLFDPE